VPQSGWLHVPRPDQPWPDEDYGPIRHTFRRTNRWARVLRHEDELAMPGREEQTLRVLFSTAPDDLGLYGKPMARNSQIWTQEHHLLLDGPNAGQAEIRTALETIGQGGLFGYRFHYPPMRAGSHEIYWHRPLVAYLSSQTGKPAVLPNAPPGYVTAYDARRLDLEHPVELWPRLLQRSRNLTAIKLFEHMKHHHKTITRALNLGVAQRLLGKRKLPRSFARQILMLPESKTLDGWLESLPEAAGSPERGQWLAVQLKEMIEPGERALPGARGKRAPASLTFGRTARRSFEVRYWKDIAFLSAGN